MHATFGIAALWPWRLKRFSRSCGPSAAQPTWTACGEGPLVASGINDQLCDDTLERPDAIRLPDHSTVAAVLAVAVAERGPGANRLRVSYPIVRD